MYCAIVVCCGKQWDVSGHNGMFWERVGYVGKQWDVCIGKQWETLGCFGKQWDVLGKRENFGMSWEYMGNNGT